MKVVFLGPPGAGKGSQAAQVAEKLGIKHASTGDIFRKAVSAGTDLAKEVKDFLDSGLLVPDELTCRVVEHEVLDKEADYILDGFPRTVVQAQMLDKALEVRGHELDLVVYYALDDKEAASRLAGRLVCRSCGRNFHVKNMPPETEGVCDSCGGELYVRSDSRPEAVEKRLAEYHEKTEPLVAYYNSNGLLREIDASQPLEDVFEETIRLLETLRE